MRVRVTIPGSVESYCIDERGDKRVASDELWLETYLCSVLRAYSYADDGSGETIRKIVGVRRFNPITTTETEHKFLQAAEQLFFRGMGRCGDVTETLTKLNRLAARVRIRGPSPKQCLEPPHRRPTEVLSDDRTVYIWHQLVRKAADKKCRGLLSPGESLVYGQRRSPGSQSPARVCQGVANGLCYARYPSRISQEESSQPQPGRVEGGTTKDGSWLRRQKHYCGAQRVQHLGAVGGGLRGNGRLGECVDYLELMPDVYVPGQRCTDSPRTKGGSSTNPTGNSIG